MLADAHAHLNDKAFPCPDDIIKLCQAARVGYLVNASWDLESAEKAAVISEKYNGCFFTVGIHPHNAEQAADGDLDKLAQLALHPKCVGWGEIGLDYHYDFSPKDIQKEMFKMQIPIAHKLGLPVVFHLRECYGDANTIIAENRNLLTDGILLHCYSGSKELAAEVYNKMDCYYSFGGAITFKNAHKEEVLQSIPQKRLLLETDCPYMAPVPLRGTTNNPSNLPIILKAFSHALQISEAEAEELTTENFLRFYRIKETDNKTL